FVEVAAAADAEIRIGFDPAGGSWSFIGRGVLDHGAGERTMNFGWDLTTDYGHGTALHEIGHTIGLPHEHQNPNAGIAWDEAAVYAYFAGDPNHWARDKTASNVLHKLAPREVSGSAWDPDSIMEYWFPAGLITAPEPYRGGLFPPGTLSALDREWAHRWYPADPAPEQHALAPLVSLPLQLAAPGQVDAVIEPPASRRYEIATFGTADTVLVLFEDDRGTLRYLAGDDDSGADRNAKLSVRLLKGRRYVARLRLYWAGETGSTALMYW
ncbi:MAG: hypothetical protein QOE28_2096, partial [Solirubrobacteraceae bacterium]|nr:hypothetical protein [Solirubrobacteraceae bacterium]